VPKRVLSLENERIVSVACGSYHTLILTQENKLFGFGSNNCGECGIKETKD
jgi:RCC1 and BTB domain-containing protein